MGRGEISKFCCFGFAAATKCSGQLVLIACLNQCIYLGDNSNKGWLDQALTGLLEETMLLLSAHSITKGGKASKEEKQQYSYYKCSVQQGGGFIVFSKKELNFIRRIQINISSPIQ